MDTHTVGVLGVAVEGKLVGYLVGRREREKGRRGREREKERKEKGEGERKKGEGRKGMERVWGRASKIAKCKAQRHTYHIYLSLSKVSSEPKGREELVSTNKGNTTCQSLQPHCLTCHLATQQSQVPRLTQW